MVAAVTDGGNPVANADVVFKVTGPNGAGAVTVRTDDGGHASFPFSGASPGTDTVEAFADTNLNSAKGATEPSDTATVLWTNDPPTSLTLSPKTETDQINTQHCVTATIKDALDRPQGNRMVRFSVTGTNPQPAASITTNFAGKAELCYTGTATGDDAIAAYADTNLDNIQDGAEPGDTSQKTWVSGTGR